MSVTSIGDMAQSLVLRTRSAELRQTMTTLTEELSSGRVSDVVRRVGGDFSYLADIERSLTRLNGFSVAASEAVLFVGATQSYLERLQDVAGSLGGTLLSAGPSNLAPVRAEAVREARAGLGAVLSALNGTIAGRSLFAGTATDQAAVGPDQTLLGAVKTVISGLGSADAIIRAAEDWFADPAGFRAVMYLGSDQALAPIQVGPGQQVEVSLRADDPSFGDLLRNIALAALVDDVDLNLAADTQTELMRTAAEGMLASQDRLVGLRSDLGFAEARIEDASSRNASARVGLEYAKGALLEADPFETATRLEDVQFRLESLYSVTVRSARLSLVSFLK